MKTPLYIALCLGIALGGLHAEQTSPSPASIDGIALKPDLWAVEVAELEETGRPLGFQWTSVAKDAARSSRRGLTLAGRPLNEVVIRLRDGKVSGVTVSYFNRGDSGDLSERDFEKLLEGIRESLTQVAGKPPVERGKDTASAVRAEGLVWDTASAKYVLEWSVTKESKTKMIPFRAEFVRLNIQPPGSDDRPIGATAEARGSRQAVKKFVGRDHIERSGNGDVKLKDVPMVDQGQKGYCVVASVERVMRYFGAEVDQHELAQIANSDAEKGTDPSVMLASLKKLTARLGVKSRPVYDEDINDVLKMIDDYNRAAKRAKVPEIVMGGPVIDLRVFFKKVQPEIYKETRLKKTADFGKFQREIQRSIGEGVPLLWSVRLGIVPEKEIPQAFGGHMRLIIGYNTTTGEVLYSDSWGMGHQEKRMPVADAWAITSGLTSLQPLGS
jgi:hypothetical protein